MIPRQPRLSACGKVSGSKLKSESATHWRSAWNAYLAQRSIFYSLFAWLPPVARKRVRLARLFLKQAWPSDLPQENWRKVEEIETTLATLVARRNDALRQQQLLINVAKRSSRKNGIDCRTGRSRWIRWPRSEMSQFPPCRMSTLSPTS